jgi:hypothetical protein
LKMSVTPSDSTWLSTAPTDLTPPPVIRGLLLHPRSRLQDGQGLTFPSGWPIQTAVPGIFRT